MNINEALIAVSTATGEFAEKATANFQIIAASIAQLNDITAELAASVSDDPEWVEMVRRKLSESSWALGYTDYAGRPGDPHVFMREMGTDKH